MVPLFYAKINNKYYYFIIKNLNYNYWEYYMW